MTTSHLLEISAMIEAGLHEDTKPQGAPCPEEPKPCPWVCPSTCRNCLVEKCQDRLAGTPDVD